MFNSQQHPLKSDLREARKNLFLPIMGVILFVFKKIFLKYFLELQQRFHWYQVESDIPLVFEGQ